MPFDPRVHVGAAAIIINPAGKLLVLKRKGAHGAGQWSLPGGWLDYDETPEDAVLRELKEEVDLEGQTPVLYDVTSHTFDSPVDTAITLFYKLPYTFNTMAARNMEPEKIEDIRFVYFEELVHMELFPPLAALIEDRGRLG